MASRLDPYGRQPPAASANAARTAALVREEGELLLVSHGTRLPDVCVKCAARDRILRRFVVMRYRPFWPAVGLFVLLGIAWRVTTVVLTLLFPIGLWNALGLVVCFAIFWRGWRYGALEMPLCPACDARWRGVVRARFLSTLAIIPVLALSAVAVELDRPDTPLGGRSWQVAFAPVMVWIVGLVAVYAGPLRKRIVGAKAILDQVIFLRGVHPDARRALVIETAASAGVRRIPPAP